MPTDTMPLAGRRIAALVTDGFEQVELTEPLAALTKQGATVDVVVPKGSTARGWNHTEWGQTVAANATLDEADAERYDGLLLPGGVLSPDQLRIDARAIAFVRAFADSGKPIAAICHGPWTLINAGVVAGRTLTSYPSLRLDLEHAGAQWVDQEVVVDGTLITSRTPADLPAFSEAFSAAFASAAHGGKQVSSAPNASFETGAGGGVVGDADVLAGNASSNTAYPEGNTYPQQEREPHTNEA